MLGWLVAAIVLGVLVAVALWTPVDFDVAAQRDARLAVHVRLSWLFGLVSTELTSGRAPPPGEPPEQEEQPIPEETSDTEWDRGSPGAFKKMMRLVRSRGFLAGALRLLRRIVTGIEIRRAELWARAGFDDPADTGRFLAVFYPVTEWLQPRYRVDLEPDFQQAIFRFDARTVIRIVPARVIGPALVFALSPATLRAAFAAVRA